MRTIRHFETRAASRGLRPDVFSFVLTWGREFHGAGARFLTVVERELPPGLPHELVERARGWVLVFEADDVLITCYRRSDATRYLRRKPRRSAIPRAA